MITEASEVPSQRTELGIKHASGFKLGNSRFGDIHGPCHICLADPGGDSEIFEAGIQGKQAGSSVLELGRQPRRPMPATVSRSSTSSAQEASMRDRLKSSSSRPVTTWYWPPETVTGYEVMMPSGAP